MIPVNHLGYQTDYIAKKLDGEFILKEAYSVVRMPSNPTFYWGNMLLYKDAPTRADFESWISAYQLEFGKDSGHLTFGWEREEVGDIQQFLECGFDLASGSVLVLDELSQSGTPCEGLTIREIDSDDDWEAVLKLQIQVSEAENPGDSFKVFKKRCFETYRNLSETGHGAWWGAFMGDTLVGDMGLYFDDTLETGRFQSVETHPDHQRKGICSTLLHSVSTHALNRYPDAKLVICTDLDSAAQRIYEKVGFTLHQIQYGVCLPRPLER